jgi:type 2 lantibiotic biosynthesis protein LanM
MEQNLATFHNRLDTRLPQVTPGAVLPQPAMTAWRQALGQEATQRLERRLAWDGLTLEEAAPRLATLLDAKPCDPAGRIARISAWLRAAAPIGDGELADPSTEPPFAELWHRLCIGARAALEQALSAPAQAAFATQHAPLDDLQRGLVLRLARMGEAVLWERFQAHRRSGAVFLAYLDSARAGAEAPGRAHYLRFLEACRADGLNQLLTEFPVLGRHLVTTVDDWIDHSRTLLERVVADLPALRDTFNLPAEARLTSIRPDWSDPHRRGCSVAQLGFTAANGTPHWVFYKPKDLRLDAAYQRVLQHTAIGSTDPPLRALKILACDGYGYMESAWHRPCTSEQQLERFYRNAGRLTACLFLLGCTDGHHENLIAEGEHWFLIDTETLLEGEQHPLTSDPHQQLNHSVLRSGLLPQWMFVGQGKIATDISALGIEPPREATLRVPDWLGRNSDGMLPCLREAPALVPTSLPVGGGERNRLGDFQDAFVTGFRLQAHSLLQQRDQWLGPDGLLDSFRGLSRRIVFRATRIYLALQRAQFTPEALRSEWAQGLVLEKLHRLALTAPQRPLQWWVGRAEIHQMERLDIPFFEQRVDRHELILEDGTVLPNSMGTTGDEMARARFRTLSTATIQRQLALIHGVITARQMPMLGTLTAGERQSGDSSPAAAVPLTTSERRAEAVRLADVLLQRAISDAGTGELEWLGIDLGADGQRFSFGPLGGSLYSGTLGIALFLMVLSSSPGIDGARYRSAARAALGPLLGVFQRAQPAEMQRWWRDQPLGLSGCGGALLALEVIARLDPWVATRLAAGLPVLLDHLTLDILSADRALDIMGGAAGLSGALVSLKTPQTHNALHWIGDHLLQQQHACGGWRLDWAPSRALTGFSHGAAGLAASLARIAAVTGGEAYWAGAHRALAYEASTFDEQAGQWPDLRHEQAEAPRFMNSWCNGAAGIGLSRLCLRDTELWTAARVAEVEVAMSRAAANPAPVDVLCCGRCGQTAILRHAGLVLGRPDWAHAAEQGDAAMVARAHRHHQGYRLFATGAARLWAPGCFTGIAGIGLQLLPEGQPVIAHLLTAGLDVTLSEEFSCQKNSSKPSSPRFKPIPHSRNS